MDLIYKEELVFPLTVSEGIWNFPQDHRSSKCLEKWVTFTCIKEDSLLGRLSLKLRITEDLGLVFFWSSWENIAIVYENQSEWLLYLEMHPEI